MTGNPRPRGWWKPWAAGLWLLVIYASVPTAGVIRGWVAGWATAEVFTGVTLAVVSAGMLAALWRVRSFGRGLTPGRGAVLLAVSGLFVWTIVSLSKTPAEAVHFVQYGILGWLLQGAMETRGLRGWTSYVAAGGWCVLAGAGDEILQYLLPGRFWDYRDLWHNALAGLLVQVALALAVHDAGRRGSPPSPMMIRLALRPWMAVAAVLVLCLNYTPLVREAVAARFPVWEFEVLNEDVMTEYGHLLHDPAGGSFPSRFDARGLSLADAAEAPRLGPLLAASVASGDYEGFLRRHSAGLDPLAHEVRVRLFRRDAYLQRARLAVGEDSGRTGLHFEVAWRENVLLERHYPALLEASGLRWDENTRAEVLRGRVPAEAYLSGVGAHLITAGGRWGLTLLTLAFGVALFLAQRALVHRAEASAKTAAAKQTMR